MPIQIVDNFDLNAAKPIDNRFVVGTSSSFYATKDDIPNKYPGLRVWDFGNQTSTGIPYVWTGTTWSGESTTSISGNGSPGFLPFFNANTIILQTDVKFDPISLNVGFGTVPDTGTSLYTNSVGKLSAFGNIKIPSGAGKFIGDGSGIVNMNATQLLFGTMPLARLQGSVNVGWFLTSDSATTATYKNPALLTVGNASRLTGTYSIFGQNFNGTQNVTGNLTCANITFGTQVNKATITYTTNATRVLTVPALDNNRTFAFLEQDQTVTGTNTFTAPVNNFNGILVQSNSLTISNSSSNNSSLTNSLRLRSTATTRYAEIRPYQGSSANLIGLSLWTSNNASPVERLRINPDGSIQTTTNATSLTFGSLAEGSPYIRTGNNNSPAAPSFTWWGNDQLGIYRPSSNVMGFVSSGVERMRVTDSGVVVSDNLVVSNNLLLNLTSNSTYNLNISNAGGSAQCVRINGGSLDSSAVTWIFASHHAGYTLPNYFIVRGNGEVDADAFNNLSDSRIKENVNTINYDPSIIRNLRPVTYNKINDIDRKVRAGFIAQEVETILPHIVRTTEHPDHEKDEYDGLRGIKHLDYISLIPYIIAELKEKDRMISDLENRLKNLEN
jgi:hypothetical protein